MYNLAPWFLLFVYVVTGFGLVRYLEKKIVNLPSRTQRLLLQYIFCFSLAVIFWLIKDRSFNEQMIAIFIIGIGNGIAVFNRWKATEISLSGTSVWSFMDDLVAMALAFFILNEVKILNIFLTIGISIAILSIVLLGFQKKHHGWPIKFFLYVGVSSILWGIAYFSQRFFASGGVSSSEYILAWYGGSLLTASLIRLFWKETGQAKLGTPLSKKDVLVLFTISISIFTTVLIATTILKNMPQIIFQPILLVSEAVIPTLMGLIIFREKQNYSSIEKILLFSAILGVIFMAIGISY
jgi:hypothetical protein